MCDNYLALRSPARGLWQTVWFQIIWLSNCQVNIYISICDHDMRDFFPRLLLQKVNQLSKNPSHEVVAFIYPHIWDSTNRIQFQWDSAEVASTPPISIIIQHSPSQPPLPSNPKKISWQSITPWSQPSITSPMPRRNLMTPLSKRPPVLPNRPS